MQKFSQEKKLEWHRKCLFGFQWTNLTGSASPPLLEIDPGDKRHPAEEPPIDNKPVYCTQLLLCQMRSLKPTGFRNWDRMFWIRAAADDSWITSGWGDPDPSERQRSVRSVCLPASIPSPYPHAFFYNVWDPVCVVLSKLISDVDVPTDCRLPPPTHVTSYVHAPIALYPYWLV